MIHILDGAQMTDCEAIHDELAAQLSFPGYYGRNLDALYDMLTERKEPLTVVLTNKDKLSSYGLRVVNTIIDAANCNPLINFEEKDC